jgi:hypothetical protein
MLKDQPGLQLIVFFLQSVIVFIYIIHAKPFDDSELNRIEIFNEMCILVTAYHLVCFTDLIPDDLEYDEIHKGIGISMVAVTALNVTVNTCIMIYKTCKKIK